MSEASDHPAVQNQNGSNLKWALFVLPFGYLWFHLLNNLWFEWSSNPEYSYGLVVPFLVIGLLTRRWINFPNCRARSLVVNPWPTIWLCVFLSFLFLPTRLVDAAMPEWRPLELLLALEVVGLTLTVIYLAGGKNWLRLAAFPVAFFLVAVPWLPLLEQSVIQGFSRLNASLSVEILGMLGVPAMAHGNVIEVGTGMVGINDACSGIRSFQSSLMISLFLGEFFLFDWRRRLLILPIGFLLAMGLNLFRTSLLTWLAAKKGIAAIAEYHDEAGLTIMLICTAGLWGAAWLMRKNNKPIIHRDAEKTNEAGPNTLAKKKFQLSNRFAIILISWLGFVEVSVQSWYCLRESNLKPGPTWTLNFPADNPTYKNFPMTQKELDVLRFNKGEHGQWHEPDGTDWEMFYFYWQPGKVAGYLAKRHTPEICLRGLGLKLVAGPVLKIINVHGINLAMRSYTFESAGELLQVFQCHWEAGVDMNAYTAEESTRYNFIRSVWAGRGNRGQKVLEIGIAGCQDLQQAQQVLLRQLNKLIQVDNSKPKSAFQVF